MVEAASGAPARSPQRFQETFLDLKDYGRNG
jgi:hypothetical protein